MKDPRYSKLADVLLHHSTKLQQGEKLLIEAIDVPDSIIIELIRKAESIGAIPLVTIKQNTILRELYRNATPEGMQLIGEIEAERMQQMDAYIALRGSHNITELSDVPDEKMKLYQKYWWQPVHIEIRVPKTKWVVLRWPNPSMAQQANQSTEAFEEFFFNVCTLDYAKMSRAMDPLQKRMAATDSVHIKAPGTDLSFSIKGIDAIKCDGKKNIPDGECYSAPVRKSIDGMISFNTPTVYLGTTFENIRLEFEKGKIVKATSDKTDKMNKILDTDEGARYTGEFSLGFNPYIIHPMKDTLFDEKIAGSLHLTPGGAYEDADNGNKSQVHWDLVLIQTPEYGGGEIYFDAELIRKDGRFVPEDLQGLNPENLK